MKQLFPAIILILLLNACTKGSTADDPTQTPQTPTDPDAPAGTTDTLNTGWSVSKLEDANLNDIVFINKTGFTASNKIYKSIDGGSTWQVKYTAYTPILTIAMGSENNAIFASSYPLGQLYFTNDGGQHFDSIHLADPGLTGVFFVNENLAYAFGLDFWRTENAGKTWKKLSGFSMHVSIWGNYKSLFFLNELNGFVAYEDGIFETKNGGISWSSLWSPNSTELLGRPAGLIHGNVFFIDRNHAYMPFNTYISKAWNGGMEWLPSFLTTGKGFHDIQFTDDKKGWVTDFQYIWKTVDDGKQWTKEVALPGRILRNLHFTNENNGWACGSNGTLLKFAK